jgi:hypothetical protein
MRRAIANLLVFCFVVAFAGGFGWTLGVLVLKAGQKP